VNSVFTVKIVLESSPSNSDGFLVEKPVFVQLSQTGLFGAKGPYLYYETLKLKKVFLSKTKSILPGKQFATCSSSTTFWFLSGDI
jgi:hypothetical protein